MTFKLCIFSICFLPFAAFSANPPCGLSDFEETGKGWLSSKNSGALRFVVARKQFESPTMPKGWTVSSQAREAAIKGFSDYFRKIAPPSVDKNVLAIKGVQAYQKQCAEGVYIFYDVNLSDLSWETAVSATTSSKEDSGLMTEESRAADLLPNMPLPKQPLMKPLGMPKVVIED